MKTLRLNTLTAFSANNPNNGYSYNFKDVNVIHGANTSGKSTLIQTILYLFGINDVNKFVEQIYSGYYLRLDVTMASEDNSKLDITIVREKDTIWIKESNRHLISFFGISANKSVEHSRIKEYFRQLLGYDLMLFQNSEYIEASLETMFLPYYISQSVGWVSVRRTFDGLEYYKNFKEDYLDFCFGITNPLDLKEKEKIEEELTKYKLKQDFLNTYQHKFIANALNTDLYVDKCEEYVTTYCYDEKQLQEKNAYYVKIYNERSYLQTRLKVINATLKNIREQNPQNAKCPFCNNSLTPTLEAIYEYSQNFNDLIRQKKDYNVKIKALTSEINSTRKIINNLSAEIKRKRNTLDSYAIKGSESVSTWLDGLTEYKLLTYISNENKNISLNIKDLNDKLKKFKTSEIIKKDRLVVINKFKSLFKCFLKELEVNYEIYENEDRFFDLYKISALPYQGVELLKAYLAYHFAFNLLLSQYNTMPRLPFMLDAIFKEDIEIMNKKLILNFISEHQPKDSQLIFSMADTQSAENQLTAQFANENFFSNEANLIFISSNPRGLIKENEQKIEPIAQETLELIYSF